MGKHTEKDKTIDLLNWISQYTGFWMLICTPDDERMTPAMMKKLVEQLARARLYEIIVVMLTVHRNDHFVDYTFKLLLLELVISEWKGEAKGREKLIGHLTRLLT